MPGNYVTDGPFAGGVARRVKRGAPFRDENGAVRIEDRWSAVLPPDRKPPLAFKLKGQSPNVAGMPRIGDGHPDFGGFEAKRVEWDEPEDGSLVWTATVRYLAKTKKTKWVSIGGLVDILNVSFYSSSVAVQFPVCNTAGEPVTPDPVIEVSAPCVRARVLSRQRPESLLDLMGAVNAEDIKILGIRYPRRTARCIWSAETTEDDDGNELFDYTFDIQGNFTPCPERGVALEPIGSGSYLTHQFSDLFSLASGSKSCRLSGWTTLVANAGPCYRGTDGKLIRARVSAMETEGGAGSEVTASSPIPVFLDEDGAKLDIGGGADPTYLLINPFPEASFSRLGLPREN